MDLVLTPGNPAPSGAIVSRARTADGASIRVARWHPQGPARGSVLIAQGRAEFIEMLSPKDFETRYRSSGGAIYGTSSNGMRAAFRRPVNVGSVKGLYLVGGSSHPGGGLPMVTTSARIVSELISTR